MAVEVKQAKSTEQKLREHHQPRHCEGADTISRTTGPGPTVSMATYHSGHHVNPGTSAKPTDGRVADNQAAKTQGSGGNP
jgi:hypothetical protein